MNILAYDIVLGIELIKAGESAVGYIILNEGMAEAMKNGLNFDEIDKETREFLSTEYTKAKPFMPDKKMGRPPKQRLKAIRVRARVRLLARNENHPTFWSSQKGLKILDTVAEIFSLSPETVLKYRKRKDLRCYDQALATTEARMFGEAIAASKIEWHSYPPRG